MAVLTAEQQTFIVVRLACFESLKEIGAELKEEFGIEVDKRQIQNYDATRGGKKPGTRWVTLFEETRKRFLTDVSDIPIANMAVRLRRLERLYTRTEEGKNTPLAADLLKQAAQDIGGAFTNQRQLTGKDGGPIETAAVTLSEEERAKRVTDLLATALARRNGNGAGHPTNNGNGNGNGRLPTP